MVNNEMRWQLNRAGLVNFWYYDEEDFYFSDGKLLLRGSNGSGKSVTMQSLIPVLLDGRKAPDRLDPFGSRSRKMEDYLLGEKDVVNRDERTGYLYLEYKRKGLEQFITTGIGLRAKRHSPMDFWGFIIQDNRRIGHQLQLYNIEYSGEDGKEVKVPLSRQELENRIGQGGRLVRGQGEYMELVNKYIFGFESIEAYEELIKLLIQLRSPKLSKDFRPTVIYDILNESLPALSDEELRPLSDTIENMDQTKQQLDQLQRDQQSLKRLCRQYDKYNQVVLAEKADGFIKTDRDLRKIQKEKEKLATELSEHERQHEKCDNKLKELDIEKQALEAEANALNKHAVFDAEKERISLEEVISQMEEQRQQKDNTLTHKLSKETELRKRIDKEEESTAGFEKEINDILIDLEHEGEEAKFQEHETAATEFKENYKQEFYFELWKKESKEYLRKLETVLKVLQEETRAMNRYQDTDREVGEAQKELDRLRQEEKKWYNYFEEEREKLLANIHQWLKANKELIMTDEEILKLIRAFTNLYEEYSFEEARSPMFQAKQRSLNSIEKEKIELSHKIGEKEKEKGRIENEISEWKNKKDPEPERHLDTMKYRIQLEEAKVPYLPFFAAVEFKADVPLEIRERLEGAIACMGLLDTLIIPEKYTKRLVEHDKVFKPKPHILAHTLADYLYPTPMEGDNRVTAEDIDGVLRSILVGEAQGEATAAALDKNGHYCISLLKGHAPREEQAIYIGKEARLRYRRQVIARLTDELAMVMRELDALGINQNVLKVREMKLEDEYSSFPMDTDTRYAFNTYLDLKRNVKNQIGVVEKVNEKLKQDLDKLNEIKEILRNLVIGMPLSPKEEVYVDALEHMKEYLSYLQSLEISYQKYLNGVKLLAQSRENLNGIELDVDELKGELNILQGKLEINNRQLGEVFKKLQELGAEEIREEINRVEKRLKEIPKEMIEMTEKKTNAYNAIGTLNKDIGDKDHRIQIIKELHQIWEKVFLEEVSLNLIKDKNLLFTEKEDNPLKYAGRLLQKVGHLLQESDREKVSDSLHKTFHQEHGILVEYRPSQDVICELKINTDELSWQTDDDTIQLKFKQLAQTSRRFQLMLEYAGKRVSPYFVLEEMNNDIELQETILSKKDRELYEEIILHSVGRIIRSRIYRAEKWVSQIDDLMAIRDTSNGLTFSLKWKPRTAEREEELDTLELVEILRRDSRLLGGNDIDRVTRHFRSQIERAKESMIEKGFGETLHQVIKEMLDYRRWFSFTLYYKKAGETKKELTNHVFFTFSGGEKAMAMYIPLFSAAYSRYLEAKDDAPFIISLDEAFAGVDEQNIRDMFDLAESLGFNYIINSQSLWGDYDTVPALSINELVRPQNAPYVTVIRYYWNGKVRRILRPQEELPTD
ncbi:TIGR02680 family protein [Desulfitibacter alkalitolerans]|uniref:TIGR02680 family protein n=1 Tax=Desulfitibacter alkalitolerans TaxID=264641 RepID=UPI0004866F2B|nr:TIGR02680 family protein [Desulfitibacter alkalitolerans]